MHILIDKSITAASALFSPYGEITLGEITPTLARQANVLLVRSNTKVNQSLLREANELRFVGSITSGINHLDTEYLRQRKIHWASAAGSNAAALVDYVLSSLAIAGDLRPICQGRKSLGLIGGGHTAKRLAKRIDSLAQLMGYSPEIYCHDPFMTQEEFARRSFTPVSFIQLLRQNCISIHCSLTKGQGEKSSHFMLDNLALSQLKSDCLLINTARGEVIEPQALSNLITKKRAPRLIMDVWNDEPLPSLPLMHACLIATPHIAGYSRSGKKRALYDVYDAFLRHEGKTTAKRHSPSKNELYVAPNPQPMETLYDYIHRLLLINYDPCADSLHARQLLDSIKDETARAQAFIRLRHDYVLRREGCEWRLSHLPDSYQAAARAVLVDR